MRRIIFACDSFKGTLPSFKVGEAAEIGFRDCFQYDEGEEYFAVGNESSRLPPEHRKYVHCPMSDGGGGLIDSVTYEKVLSERSSSLVPPVFAALPFISSEEFQPHHTTGPPSVPSATSCFPKVNFQRVRIPSDYPIHGPLGEIIKERPCFFACDVKQRVVLVEMAEAAGLARIAEPGLRSPWETTSYGVGDIVKYAMRYITQKIQDEKKDEAIPSELCGCREKEHFSAIGITVLLGIGGSATNDGGLGALQSLGLDIYLKPCTGDGDGNATFRLTEPFCGKHLSSVHFVELTPKLRGLFSGKGQTPMTSKDFRCFIDNMFLICDVENPLTGPDGATFIFGPQKCSPVVEGYSGVEDAAVGTVKTVIQKEMLCRLEEGMKHAAKRVVASVWSQIIAWHQERELHRVGEAFSNPSTGFLSLSEISEDSSKIGLIEKIQDNLLHSPRGGGAGGMSGFFGYVLGTSCLPGGDMVAALQGLRVMENFPWMTAPTPICGTPGRLTLDTGAMDGGVFPFGLLFDDWDTLVTGEGSFDTQSIYSRKTVGKLLEMVIEANAWRWIRGYSLPSASLSSSSPSTSSILINDVIVVCGRTGFRTPQEAIEALKSVLMKEEIDGTPMSPFLHHCTQKISEMIATPSAPLDKVLDLLIPQFRILVLTEHFSMREAMKNPYECVVEVVKKTFGSRSHRVMKQSQL